MVLYYGRVRTVVALTDTLVSFGTPNQAHAISNVVGYSQLRRRLVRAVVLWLQSWNVCAISSLRYELFSTISEEFYFDPS